jgi:NAD(P)-dependent dehydrogenase (short-subunit alcohol dehydrogenase family)
MGARPELATSTPGSGMAGGVAIVTGGASGIGRATSEALARAGSRVVVVDIDADGVDETLRLLRATTSTDAVTGLALDVRREVDMEEMARSTMDRFGRIDMLVSCAGILRAPGSLPKPVVDMTVDEWDAVVDVNLRGVFLSNRAVLPTMIAQGSGQIVNVSSTSGRQGRALDGAYCASKAGVIGLTESLAEEVRQLGIRVQCVLPDAVETPLWRQNGAIPPPPDILPPSRVADVIVYLLALPADAVILNATVAPLRRGRRRPRRETEGAVTGG